MNDVKTRVTELIAENYSQSDVASMVGISRQRVNQILNPLKHAARVKAQTLKTDKPELCVGCQGVKKLEAHHPDYEQPLLVKWLCKACHTKQHFPNAKPRKVHIPYHLLKP